jgi:hypothetical protein
MRAIAALVFVLLLPPIARAADDGTAKARAEFLAGTEHVQAARWGEAIAAFERSHALRPHPLTTYNIGACERALGRYTRARDRLRAAISEDQAAGGKALDPTYAAEAKTWLDQIEGLLVHVNITLSPTHAALSVDGRPLLDDTWTKSTKVAGLAPPGPGKPLELSKVQVLLDPGPHVFVVSAKGFGDSVVNKSFGAGAKVDLVLELERLPAKLRIRATQPGAVVTVDGLDVGVAPVDLTRPPGVHAVVVRKPGFVSYSTQIDVAPGQESNLSAALEAESVPVTKRWWFWTAAGVVVTGAAVSTYFLTRPTPERPAVDGGGLGWAAKVP